MNTDGIEKVLALQAMLTPEQRQRRLEDEAKTFGPYPSNNRHERRRALALLGESRSALPPKRTPLVYTARGPATSRTYQQIRHAQKQGRTVRYEDRKYRVASLVKGDDGRFEAQLVEVV